MSHLVSKLAVSLVCLVLVTPAAVRAGHEPPKPEHMKFDDDAVTGDIVRPDGDRVGGVTRRKRTSLIEVRANFLAELVASTEDL